MQELFPNWCGFNLNSVAFYYFCSRWFDNDIILHTLFSQEIKKFFRTISMEWTVKILAANLAIITDLNSTDNQFSKHSECDTQLTETKTRN